MASVRVTVRGPGSEVIDDAIVRYSVDGGAATNCETMGEGQYVCGWEVRGPMVITVQRDGYIETLSELTVEADACHVIGQTLEVALELAPHFAQARVYSSILIADELACETALAQGYNCARVVEFCPDGSFTIMLTDIVSQGTYARDDQGVALDCRNACDIPAAMRFAHDQETDVLTDDHLQEDWVRVSMDAGFGGCS